MPAVAGVLDESTDHPDVDATQAELRRPPAS